MYQLFSLSYVLICTTLLTGIIKASPNVSSTTDDPEYISLFKSPLNNHHLDALLKTKTHLSLLIDKDGSTLLHIAAVDGNEELATRLLHHDEKLLNQRNQHGWTPLHCAAAAGHTNVVNLLLAWNADKEVKNQNNDSPYELALRFGYQELAQLLGV